MMHYGRFGYGPGFGGSYGFGMIGELIGALLFVAILVGFIIVIIRISRSKGRHPMFWEGTAPSHIVSALAILNERYAKGEIDEEEYKRKKADISEIIRK